MLRHVGGYTLALGHAEPESDTHCGTAFREVSVASVKPKKKAMKLDGRYNNLKWQKKNKLQ